MFAVIRLHPRTCVDLRLREGRATGMIVAAVAHVFAVIRLHSCTCVDLRLRVGRAIGMIVAALQGDLAAGLRTM